jgi:hypothetical protein
MTYLKSVNLLKEMIFFPTDIRTLDIMVHNLPTTPSKLSRFSPVTYFYNPIEYILQQIFPQTIPLFITCVFYMTSTFI